jgi:hypothetical protein
MKQKFGSIVVSGSGKLGGHVVTQVKGLSVLLTKRRASSVQSIATATQRHNFSIICKNWSLLTENQRLTWRHANYNGDIGVTLYKSCNLNRLLLGFSILTDFPGLAIFAQPEPARVVAYGDSGVFRMFLSNAVPSGYSLKIFASNLKSNGVSDVKRGNKLLTVANESSGTFIELRYVYLSLYNTLVVSGYNLSIRLVLVHNASGLESASTYQLVHVIDSP